MTEPLVLYTMAAPAAVITLNRPDRRNALSHGLIIALTEAFGRARDDAAARCVILTGAGPAFCAGMDLAELADTLKQTPDAETTWEEVMHLARLYDLIYTLPKPTIAAINGSAVAGGAGLMSVCDLALAVPEAKFGYPEVRRGLVAALVMPHLLRHVGERMARFLLLAGELIDASAACAAGLINAVVPAAELMERVHTLARAAAEGGPRALASTKSILHTCSRQALPIEELARASAAPRLTDECRQGLQAFFDKKPVPWAAK